MATLKVDDVNLFHSENGSGKEAIIFSHGFLMDHSIYQAQIEALAPHFRYIAYDHRGHGRSEAVTAVMLDFYTQIGAIPKD